MYFFLCINNRISSYLNLELKARDYSRLFTAFDLAIYSTCFHSYRPVYICKK